MSVINSTSKAVEYVVICLDKKSFYWLIALSMNHYACRHNRLRVLKDCVGVRMSCEQWESEWSLRKAELICFWH